MARGCMDSNSCQASKLLKCKTIWAGFSRCLGLLPSFSCFLIIVQTQKTQHDSAQNLKSHLWCPMFMCLCTTFWTVSQWDLLLVQQWHNRLGPIPMANLNRNDRLWRRCLIKLWELRKVPHWKKWRAHEGSPVDFLSPWNTLFVSAQSCRVSFRDWHTIHSVVTWETGVARELQVKKKRIMEDTGKEAWWHFDTAVLLLCTTIIFNYYITDGPSL